MNFAMQTWQGTPLPPTEIIKTLTGHSGCSVFLCRSGERYFVRKISASPAYNARFSEQITKQIRLAEIVAVPRVDEFGTIDGLHFCDMEYVSSLDFRTFLSSNQIATLPILVRRILILLQRMAAPSDACIESDLFTGKIRSTADNLRNSVYYSVHAQKLERAIATLLTSNWQGIPKTSCHGDFTLENMLIKEDGSIILIDLLDGDLETVWLDVAKLLHDLQIGWSFRDQLWKTTISAEDRLSWLLCKYFHDELLEEVEAMFPGILEKLPALKSLQALRVLPYATSPMVFAKLVAVIEHNQRTGSPS